MYQSFEDLDVWKRSCQLSVQVYEMLRDCRDFALRDQMQRAAVSIPSNIAEGCERGGKDFIRFLSIARGSAAELRTQCYIAMKAKIITDSQMKSLTSELKEISRMLTGLANSIHRKLNPEHRQLNTEH
ncbi:MAG: four helix bundle protein [Gemmatales bacterium]|nr:MAG: four helix bundle protein [Gemmatales bacterium]GIX00476.1 MAG: four helix bundle protein [Pirellulaceae bacterium]